jgi:hypothetical protein
LEQINSLGMLVIILTTRDPDKIREWLLQNDMIHLVTRVTREKPPALVYLDDRAVCFRGNFVEAWAAIKRFVPYWREEDGPRDEVIRLLGLEILANRGLTCIHDGDPHHDRYCDDCPLRGKGFPQSMKSLLCRKSKNFSK